jgi:hypothetical protein
VKEVSGEGGEQLAPQQGEAQPGSAPLSEGHLAVLSDLSRRDFTQTVQRRHGEGLALAIRV